MKVTSHWGHSRSDSRGMKYVTESGILKAEFHQPERKPPGEGSYCAKGSFESS